MKKIFHTELLASLVVFLVAMPLTLGIALASGAPVASALVTAIVGGILVGALSGAPLNVTGPAAGLTTLVYQIIQDFGLKGLAIITALAGLIQLSIGFAKIGKIFYLVPKSILNGMLMSIGFIIFVGQIHVLLGQNVPKGFLNSIGQFPSSFQNMILPVLFLGLAAILIQIVWNHYFKISKTIPAALPAVFIITLLSLGMAIPRIELTSLGGFAGDSLQSFFNFDFTNINSSYIYAALGLALVASAESLLTARAVTELAIEKKVKTNLDLNKELIAQGVGNTFSGLLGGLPMTGVIVRSAANLHAGAQTRFSAILHGLWILLFVVVFPNIASQIPLVVLSAILILTSFKLLNFKNWVNSFKRKFEDGFFWTLTTASILFSSLLTGLIVSLSIYSIYILSLKIIKMYKTNNVLLKQ